MGEEVRSLITFTIATTIGLATIAGLVVRFALLPYLREHITRPVAAVRDQVQNDHRTNLRDDLDGMRDEGRSTRASVDTLTQLMAAQGGAVREHLRWSEEWVADAEQATRQTRAQLEELTGRVAGLERAMQTRAEAEASLWPAIEAVAKASPPDEPGPS